MAVYKITRSRWVRVLEEAVFEVEANDTDTAEALAEDMDDGDLSWLVSERETRHCWDVVELATP